MADLMAIKKVALKALSLVDGLVASLDVVTAAKKVF